MIFIIRVDVGGSMFPMGHVEAASREVALCELGLEYMPSGTQLSESKEVGSFDQFVSAVVRQKDRDWFATYYEAKFEKAKKPPAS